MLASAATAAGEDMMLDGGEASGVLLQMFRYGIDIFFTISQLVWNYPITFWLLAEPKYHCTRGTLKNAGCALT